MKMEWTLRFCLAFAAPLACSASLTPYAPDAATLHLWHLDEEMPPLSDAGSDRLDLPVLAGGATLGNPSFPGFGTALI
jgi:hypothetical protein